MVERFKRGRLCGNPRCMDWVSDGALVRVCPSCRLAWGWGAVPVGLLSVAYHAAVWLGWW